MFSVVIPLYNKELSIKNTLQSVLNQTFCDFEIIIVNDGSTDDSVKVVQRFSDERIRLIHQKNQGVSAARNRGIKKAKYEWICFLDGDDLWYPEKLEKFNYYLKKFPKVNWGFAGYDLYKDLKLKRRFIFEADTQPVDNIFDFLLKGIKIHTSSVVVRKSFLQDNNVTFTVGINNSEDREVWYKCCCFDKHPLYIKESLSSYILYSGQNSLVKSNTDFHFLTMEKRLQKQLSNLTNEDKGKLLKKINGFNKLGIYGYWMRNPNLPVSFLEYLDKKEKFIMMNFIKFPKKVKKAIVRFYLNR